MLSRISVTILADSHRAGHTFNFSALGHVYVGNVISQSETLNYIARYKPEMLRSGCNTWGVIFMKILF